MNRRIFYLVLIVVLIFIIILTVLNIFDIIEGYGIRNMQAVDSQITGEIRTYINDNLEKARSDALFFAEFMGGSSVLNSDVNVDYDYNLKRVQDIFVRFAAINNLYSQVRFINDEGDEIIRVDNNGRETQLVQDDKLQNKADRPYFRNIINQQKGSVYVSPIDLNVENGEIEVPLNPMLRVGAPVYDRSNRLKGVIVLNISGDRLLEFLDGYDNISIINQDGMYIYNRDSSKRWGKILGTNEGFPKDFSEDAMLKIARAGEGYIEENGKLITFKRFDAGHELWYVLLSNDIAAIAKPYNDLKRALLIATMAGSGVAGLLFVLFLREYRRSVTSEKLEETNRLLIAKQSELEEDYALVEELNAQLDEQTKNLRKQRDITLAVVDSVDDYIILFREDGTITINRNAKGLFNFEADDTVKAEEWARVFFKPFTPDGLADELVSLLSDRFSSLQKEIYLIPRSMYFKLYSVPVSMESGEYIGRLVVLHDITREKEVDRLKSELISTVSHELRTPMSSILGFAELLTTRQLAEGKKKEYIGIIQSEAKRLTQLINDFLDIQRMESGRQVYNMRKVDIKAVAEETVRLYRDSSGRDILLETSSTIPFVYGDEDKIKQVFSNLISNAVKYSSEGDIRISLSRDGMMVKCSVSDRGIGIPDEEKDKIFERFFRVHSEDTREIGGTGLGLAICREIVTAHGGDIWFESEVGKGSTFSFTIPIYREVKEDSRHDE